MAAILHIGNIRFEGDAPARVSNKDTLDFAAYLLGLDPSTLSEALVHRAIQTGSARASVYSVPQNPDQASGIRDALAKALYERIFDWLVHRINVALGSRGKYQPFLNIIAVNSENTASNLTVKFLLYFLPIKIPLRVPRNRRL